MLTVSELIEHLQTFPGDLPVAYYCFSESRLLEKSDIEVEQACNPRPDGWVARSRPDKPRRPYLMFPGN